MGGNTFGDRMRNECICSKLKVVLIEDNKRKNQLNGHVQQKIVNSLVEKGDRL